MKHFRKDPVQLQLPFPPHELSNVLDITLRIEYTPDQDRVGFTSFDPIQLELSFPHPDAPKVLDFLKAHKNKLNENWTVHHLLDKKRIK